MLRNLRPLFEADGDEAVAVDVSRKGWAEAVEQTARLFALLEPKLRPPCGAGQLAAFAVHGVLAGFR